jgi:hypothetical protein
VERCGQLCDLAMSTGRSTSPGTTATGQAACLAGAVLTELRMLRLKTPSPWVPTTSSRGGFPRGLECRGCLPAVTGEVDLLECDARSEIGRCAKR